MVFSKYNAWILVDIMWVDSIRIRGYGYADTDMRIRIRGYGYADTDTRIRICGYEYADTDTRIRTREYGYADTDTRIRRCGYGYAGCAGGDSGERGGRERGPPARPSEGSRSPPGKRKKNV